MSTKAFLASVFYSVEMLCLLENNWKIRQLRKKKQKNALVDVINK